MIYYINQTVKFDTENKLLSTGEYEHPLPNASVRLLETLIINNGIVVSRDDLIHIVWENQGFASSGNSLTNNISLIRKAFALTGLEGIIETIPKQGFRLDARQIDAPVMTPEDVIDSENPAEVIESNESELNSRHIVNYDSYFFENDTSEKVKTNRTFKASDICIIIALVLFYSCAGVVIYKHYFSDSILKNGMVFLKKFKECEIYRSHNASDEGALIFLEKKYAKDKLNTSCVIDGIIIYDETHLRVASSPVESFVSYCSSNREGSENDCENYIHIETK